MVLAQLWQQQDQRDAAYDYSRRYTAGSVRGSTARICGMRGRCWMIWHERYGAVRAIIPARQGAWINRFSLVARSWRILGRDPLRLSPGRIGIRAWLKCRDTHGDRWKKRCGLLSPCSHMLGGYSGGQAEYLRVPYADVGPIKVPQGLSDEQVLLAAD
jgi:hypothetical protein